MPTRRFRVRFTPTLAGPLGFFKIAHERAIRESEGLRYCSVCDPRPESGRPAVATGSNSEQLGWVSCDVSALAGKKARIVITDRATGPWGHLLADHIVQSDKKAEDWK